MSLPVSLGGPPLFCLGLTGCSRPVPAGFRHPLARRSPREGSGHLSSPTRRSTRYRDASAWRRGRDRARGYWRRAYTIQPAAVPPRQPLRLRRHRQSPVRAYIPSRFVGASSRRFAAHPRRFAGTSARRFAGTSAVYAGLRMWRTRTRRLPGRPVLASRPGGSQRREWLHPAGRACVVTAPAHVGAFVFRPGAARTRRARGR